MHHDPFEDLPDDDDLTDDDLTDDDLDSPFRLRFAPEQRLWCLHCRRHFLGRDARPDPFGGVQGCPFEGCGAAGYQVDVFDACDPDEGCEESASDLDLLMRDDLLRVVSSDEVDEVTPFDDLDLERLATLLACRYVDPDGRHGRAPSTVECVAFLCRWPEARAHGAALHPARCPDGASVRIEGLACDLDGVDEPRRAPLRDAFRAFAGADAFVDEGARLFAWWE